MMPKQTNACDRVRGEHSKYDDRFWWPYVTENHGAVCGRDCLAEMYVSYVHIARVARFLKKKFGQIQAKLGRNAAVWHIQAEL